MDNKGNLPYMKVLTIKPNLCNCNMFKLEGEMYLRNFSNYVLITPRLKNDDFTQLFTTAGFDHKVA